MDLVRHAPGLYGLGARAAVRLLAWLGRKNGRIERLPFATGWTGGRDLPAPEGKTFQELWRADAGGIRSGEG